MQNRYIGDIGDFAKYALLRYLSIGYRLGVAWYLYPDEAHNEDGRYTEYLGDPSEWCHLDPELFNTLRDIVQSNRRSVLEIENSGLLGNAIFSHELLEFDGPPSYRAQQRLDWFDRTSTALKDATLIFTDPDNGLCEDDKYSPARTENWKRMPITEARVLTSGRTGILYHHNTRRAGGHLEEIQYWLNLLGPSTLALYWRRHSNRTFFIVNPDAEIRTRVRDFAKLWTPHFELHVHDYGKQHLTNKTSRTRSEQIHRTTAKSCPECGHTFSGSGWIGIDAHWKSNHEDIMPYSGAWPLIKSGRRPSESK